MSARRGAAVVVDRVSKSFEGGRISALRELSLDVAPAEFVALTVQIADPFGGVHPVAYDNTKKNIVRRPFDGTFRDYVQFPADSRGFKLTVRITVWAKGSKVVLSYWIRAR